LTANNERQEPEPTVYVREASDDKLTEPSNVIDLYTDIIAHKRKGRSESEQGSVLRRTHLRSIRYRFRTLHHSLDECLLEAVGFRCSSRFGSSGSPRHNWLDRLYNAYDPATGASRSRDGFTANRTDWLWFFRRVFRVQDRREALAVFC